jgi:hypothetical protein
LAVQQVTAILGGKECVEISESQVIEGSVRCISEDED